MAPGSEPVVEPAGPEDVEAVTDCWVALADEQRAHGSHVIPEPNRAAIRETLAAHRVDDGLLVARVDGEIGGFVSFAIERGSFALDATRGLISNLYVRPAFRNRGIGTALLEAAEERLADRGADLVGLEAMAPNEGARRFYRRNGYEPHRVAMERPLADRENDTHSRADE